MLKIHILSPNHFLHKIGLSLFVSSFKSNFLAKLDILLAIVLGFYMKIMLKVV